MTTETLYTALIIDWLLADLWHRYLERKHPITYYLFYGIGVLSTIPSFFISSETLAQIPYQLRILYVVVMLMPWSQKIGFPILIFIFQQAEQYVGMPFMMMVDTVTGTYDAFLCFLEWCLRIDR